jgi:undecaprenyl-diphosphatase
MEYGVEHLNQTLFLMINSGVQPDFLTLWFVKIVAELPVWLIPSLLVAGWLRGDAAIRQTLLMSALTAGVALSVNQFIGLFWQHPRPFMMGLGHTLISHVADSSFPSDHMTLICSVGLSLLWNSALRTMGSILMLLALPVAWARIYLGVHFPFDMVGAFVVSLTCAYAMHKSQTWISEPIFKLVSLMYEWVMAPAIRRGWLR